MPDVHQPARRLEGNARDIEQRMALAVVARSPIERLVACKRERGWGNLRLYSDVNGAYSRDYFGVRPTAPTTRASTSSPGTTAGSAISGAAR